MTNSQRVRKIPAYTSHSPFEDFYTYVYGPNLCCPSRKPAPKKEAYYHSMVFWGKTKKSYIYKPFFPNPWCRTNFEKPIYFWIEYKTRVNSITTPSRTEKSFTHEFLLDNILLRVCEFWPSANNLFDRVPILQNGSLVSVCSLTHPPCLFGPTRFVSSKQKSNKRLKL